jgi:hypothetical protein
MSKSCWSVYFELISSWVIPSRFLLMRMSAISRPTAATIPAAAKAMEQP